MSNLPGNLKVGHIVEAALWLLLAALLYIHSFGFDREIEIYKFGAAAWPRTILLLIVIAAIGQLAYNWKTGGRDAPGMAGAAVDDSAGEVVRHTSLKWYLSTFFLLSLPLVYMFLPEWIRSWFLPVGADHTGVDKSALHAIKLGCAAALILLYIAGMRRNLVGAILALPVFFGALMQDFGFYSLAPFFAVGVMYLMGERRPSRMALSTAVILGLVLMLFVSVLYVGLPTGNVSPFYEIGTGLVNLLQ